MSGDLRKNERKSARRLWESILVRAIVTTASILPRRTGLSLFTLLGSLSYRLFRRDRERAVRNIARAFPGTPRVVVEAIARGSFMSLGRNMLDAVRLKRLSREKVLEICLITGEENLRGALEKGKGVIAPTGRIGCWEMLTACFADKGYGVTVVAEKLRNGYLDRKTVSWRRRHGVDTVHSGELRRKGPQALAGGRILAMMADSGVEADGIMAPFFGIPTPTTIDPAALALETGAAVVPMAVHTQPGGMHHVTVLPEIEHPAEGMPEDRRREALTKEISRAVERLVRLYPQQWVWLHDRWEMREERVEKNRDSGYLEVDGTG